MKKSNAATQIVYSLILVLGFALVPGANAQTQDARLNVEGDLMIHPNQMGGFFDIAANRIQSSSAWNWPSLQFTKPYRTAWSDVQALGPFNIQFDTTNLKNQEFSFDLNWNDPKISVGKFEIHDTVQRVVGGIPLVFHLDGICSNMSLQIPGGLWKVHGRMHWDFSANQFVVSWIDFALDMNKSASPKVDVGQCQGPAGLIDNLRQAVVTISHDQGWLQDVLKAGAQDWLQSTLGVLQEQLLLPRHVQVKENLKLSWAPAGLTTLPGGMIRVAGGFTLTKVGATKGEALLKRSYDPASLLQTVETSGFVMPKDSLPAILSYMYANGELKYRVQSTDVASFTSLMQSRFFQFFVWPDLMGFSKQSVFYFDVRTARAPKLTNGQRLEGGGSVYAIQAPLVVNQWAPTDSQYLPYVDFRGALTGQVYAQIQNDQLILQTRLNDLNVTAKFRSEFKAFRAVTEWIATSLLGSRAKSYLEDTPLSVSVPKWDLGPGMAIRLSDLQAGDQSFQVPLEFTSTP